MRTTKEEWDELHRWQLGGVIAVLSVVGVGLLAVVVSVVYAVARAVFW
jgi:hypothetical protein